MPREVFEGVQALGYLYKHTSILFDGLMGLVRFLFLFRFDPLVQIDSEFLALVIEI